MTAETQTGALIASIGSGRALTVPEFLRLVEVPLEAQWFFNLDSSQTRRAYQNDLRAFMAFKPLFRRMHAPKASAAACTMTPGSVYADIAVRYDPGGYRLKWLNDFICR